MRELNKRIITSFFLLLIIFFSFMNLNFLFLCLFVVNFAVLDEFLNLFKKIYKKKKIKNFTSLLLLVSYLTYFTLTIVFFLTESFDLRKYVLFFILLICIATDIGGYVFGKIIGGAKLTSISPNKTISGLVGSFVLSLIFGYLFYVFRNNFIDLNINIFIFIILTSLISQLGDLFISYLKRKAKLKDTGNILPGHGGMLDRIDGILFALPLGLTVIMLTS